MQKRVKRRKAVNPWCGLCTALQTRVLGCRLGLHVRLGVHSRRSMSLFSFSNRGGENEVANPLQDAGVAVSGGAPGAFKDLAEPMRIPKEDDDWDLKGAVGLDEAEQSGVKRRLRNLQESCRTKKQKAPAMIAEAFKLVAKLSLGGASVDNPDGSDAYAGRLCKLKERLCEVRKGAEELSTKVKELKKSWQDEEHFCDDDLITIQIERETAKKERSKATKKQHQLTKACVEMAEVSKDMKLESEFASKRYHQVLSSSRQIVKARDK